MEMSLFCVVYLKLTNFLFSIEQGGLVVMVTTCAELCWTNRCIFPNYWDGRFFGRALLSKDGTKTPGADSSGRTTLSRLFNWLGLPSYAQLRRSCRTVKDFFFSFFVSSPPDEYFFFLPWNGMFLTKSPAVVQQEGGKRSSWHEMRGVYDLVVAGLKKKKRPEMFHLY